MSPGCTTSSGRTKGWAIARRGADATRPPALTCQNTSIARRGSVVCSATTAAKPPERGVGLLVGQGQHSCVAGDVACAYYGSSTAPAGSVLPTRPIELPRTHGSCTLTRLPRGITAQPNILARCRGHAWTASPRHYIRHRGYCPECQPGPFPTSRWPVAPYRAMLWLRRFCAAGLPFPVRL